MLVDDSLVMRSILEHMLGRTDEFDIVASVPTAQDALQSLRSVTVDVIILDIEMPGMSGIAALPDLLQSARNARILILSSNCEEGGPAAVEALALGASDTLAKPGRTSFGGRFSDILFDRLRKLGDSHRAAERATSYVRSFGNDDRHVAQQIPAVPLELIAIGSSTGGIPAIHALLKLLDAGIAAPVLLTQHLPDAFIPFFARQLAQSTQRTVCVALDGMALEDHCVYLAPGSGHLTIVREGDGRVAVHIVQAEQPSGCEPSVDPMLASVAAAYGERGCAVMLSGMGRDGLEGARVHHQKGGRILAQNPETCVVWGMPGSVVRGGLATAVLSPEDIAGYLNRWGAAQ